MMTSGNSHILARNQINTPSELSCETPLFGFFLPVQRRTNKITLQRHCYSLPKRYSIQYIFDFLFIDEDNTVNFIHRSSIQTLRYETGEILSENKKLDRVADNLEESGVTHIGDLVRLKRSELLAFDFIDEESIELITEVLAEYDLKLNSRTPLWRGDAASRGHVY